MALYDKSSQTFDNVTVHCIAPCQSDLSCDLVTDGADLAILLGGWGEAGLTGLDGDGTTDGADVAILLGGWGSC